MRYDDPSGTNVCLCQVIGLVLTFPPIPTHTFISTSLCGAFGAHLGIRGWQVRNDAGYLRYQCKPKWIWWDRVICFEQNMPFHFEELVCECKKYNNDIGGLFYNCRSYAWGTLDCACQSLAAEVGQWGSNPAYWGGDGCYDASGVKFL